MCCSVLQCVAVCAYLVYGVATMSRLLKIIGVFCKRDLQKRPIFCKETYIFKHPTNRSHPIVLRCSQDILYCVAVRFRAM